MSPKSLELVVMENDAILNKQRRELVAEFDRVQRTRWMQFKVELQDLKNEYKATTGEVAAALGIHRGTLSKFLNGQADRLQVDRSDVLKLWVCLSYPDSKQKDLRDAVKKSRTKLREAGPNKLLNILGFEVEASNEESNFPKPVFYNPQIRRVVERLNSGWIYDGTLRTHIINNILDHILDAGRLDSKAYVELVSKQESLRWPRAAPLKCENEQILRKYEKAITGFIAKGKTQFVQSELFEIYQSILDHHLIISDKSAKLRIDDCQFQTISSDQESIFGLHSKLASLEIISHVKQLLNIAENRLIGLLQESDESKELNIPKLLRDAEHNLDFPPCIQVKIRCEFKTEQGERKTSIVYSSTAPHVDNMLISIKRGLCFPLRYTGFFIRAVGRTENSVTRVTIPLAESDGLNERGRLTDERIYEGHWVTTNTIIGILKATSDALTSWLSAKGIQLSEYYGLCQCLALLTNELNDMREYSYGYQPTFLNRLGKHDNEVNTRVERNEAKLVELSSNVSVFRENDRAFIDLRNSINYHTRLHQVIAMKAAIAEGSFDKVTNYVKKLRLLISEGDNFLHQGENHFRGNLGLIYLYSKSCMMTFDFFTGDREFLVGHQWRDYSKNQFKQPLTILGSYIKESTTIDYDAYLCASYMYGVCGVLDFYSNPRSFEKYDLEPYYEAVDNLIQASHYSLRIGHRIVASQWLYFASRLSARLGRIKEALELMQISKFICEEEFSGKNKPVYKSALIEDFSRTGEWLHLLSVISESEVLLFQQQLVKAFELSLTALYEAISMSCEKVIPDCLYNIARVSKALGEESKTEKTDIQNPFCMQNNLNEAEYAYIHSNGAFSAIISQFIEKSLLSIDGNSINFLKLAEEAQLTSIEAWNHWCIGQNTGQHAFSDLVSKWTFIGDLKKTEEVEKGAEL